MVTQQKSTKSIFQVIFSRNFLTLIISYLFACLAFSSVGSEFVTYGTDELGLEAVVVGSIAGMVSMIGLVMRPVTAILVDKFNRKKMLLVGYAMLTLSSIILIFARSVSGLYAAQIVRGAAWALQNSAGFIMVGEVVDKDDLGMAMSVYSMAQVIASSFSAVLILAIANSLGFEASFIATSVFTAISLLLIVSLPYKSKIKEGQEKLVDALKGIRLKNLFSVECLPILVISFAFQFVSIMMGASWVVKFAKTELNIMNAGLFATVANLIMYVTKPYFGRVMDKYGARWCVYASGAGYALACLVMARSTSMTGLIIAAVIYGVLCGGNAMAGRTMAMKRMPVDKQAVASSTVGIGNDIGMTVANILIPVWAGMFGGYSGVYNIMAAISAAVIIYSAIYGRIYLKKNPENEMRW